MKSLLKDSVRGKYAQRYKEGTNLVLLDPDVAEFFTNAEQVNEILRLAMKMKKVQEKFLILYRELGRMREGGRRGLSSFLLYNFLSLFFSIFSKIQGGPPLFFPLSGTGGLLPPKGEG